MPRRVGASKFDLRGKYTVDGASRKRRKRVGRQKQSRKDKP